MFCQDSALAPLDGAGRAALREQIRTLRVEMDARSASSRVLAGLQRMHVEGEAGTDVLAALASNDLTLPELLHGRPSFQLLTTIAERVAPDAPFLDLFWHYRAIFAPVLRLLAAPTVRARCYHAVATGYAGLLAALWSHRTGRPLMVTEHGIYARERDMELARADWIRDDAGGVSEPRSTWAPRVSPLRRLWSSFFRALSRLAYVQARNIVTLSEANRVKQIADGAPPEKIEIVPNGVALHSEPTAAARRNRPPAITQQRDRLAGPPHARRLRGPGRADQGPGHVRARLRRRARQRRARCARDRPDGGGSRLRRALPPAGGAARALEQHPVRRPDAARPASTAIWIWWCSPASARGSRW